MCVCVCVCVCKNRANFARAGKIPAKKPPRAGVPAPASPPLPSPVRLIRARPSRTAHRSPRSGLDQRSDAAVNTFLARWGAVGRGGAWWRADDARSDPYDSGRRFGGSPAPAMDGPRGREGRELHPLAYCGSLDAGTPRPLLEPLVFRAGVDQGRRRRLPKAPGGAHRVPSDTAVGGGTQTTVRGCAVRRLAG